MCLHYLCTKLCQFTKGKTEATICHLIQRYVLNANSSEHHILNIVVTNKSLMETNQWKIRVNDKCKEYENINIDILSSKSLDYKTIDSYIGNIIRAEHKNDYPNILIICFHSKRVNEDLIQLFTFFNRFTINFKCALSLDEPDANLGICKKFLSLAKPFIDNELITSIEWITATPVDDFWKMLGDSGIKRLLNITHGAPNTFNEDLENYRKFREHIFIINECDSTNPLGYIIDCFAKRLINCNQRNIIFVPGHICVERENVGSHMEIVNYFTEKGYCVYLQNGKFKGFIYPDNSRVDLKTFNSTNNISGELRESLVKWNQLNPELSLAITGHLLTQRGITFNTLGFCFTHMILSNYFLKLVKGLIQTAGRGSGGKKYVDQMTVICTSLVKKTIDDWCTKFEKLGSINPEFFNRNDFAVKNSDVAIPVKIVINDIELLNQILETVGTVGKIHVHNLILGGIIRGKISVYDRNNVKKFDISSRSLNSARMYKLGYSIPSWRFKNFDEHFENYTSCSQTCSKTQYNIDFAKDMYINGDFINETNTAWITYKC